MRNKRTKSGWVLLGISLIGTASAGTLSAATEKSGETSFDVSGPYNMFFHPVQAYDELSKYVGKVGAVLYCASCLYSLVVLVVLCYLCFGTLPDYRDIVRALRKFSFKYFYTKEGQNKKLIALKEGQNKKLIALIEECDDLLYDVRYVIKPEKYAHWVCYLNGVKYEVVNKRCERRKIIELCDRFKRLMKRLTSIKEGQINKVKQIFNKAIEIHLDDIEKKLQNGTMDQERADQINKKIEELMKDWEELCEKFRKGNITFAQFVQVADVLNSKGQIHKMYSEIDREIHSIPELVLMKNPDGTVSVAVPITYEKMFEK